MSNNIYLSRDKPLPFEELKIIIADDHPICRRGLLDIIKGIFGVRQVNEAANGLEVLSLLQQEFYDIIFMDIRMPEMDGIYASRIIKQRYPHVKIIAITSFDFSSYVLELYHIGISGYLLKNANAAEFRQAIIQVISNEEYYSKEIYNTVCKELLRKEKNVIGSAEFTYREIEILKLICEQNTLEEIGAKLFLSSRTIKRYKQILFKKADVKNIVGLAIYAIRKGIYQLE